MDGRWENDDDGSVQIVAAVQKTVEGVSIRGMSTYYGNCTIYNCTWRHFQVIRLTCYDNHLTTY